MSWTPVTLPTAPAWSSQPAPAADWSSQPAPAADWPPQPTNAPTALLLEDGAHFVLAETGGHILFEQSPPSWGPATTAAPSTTWTAGE